MKRGAALMLAGLALLSGCGNEELSGPPEIRLGRDECASCGMIISENRCSGGLLIEREGRREHAAFDDLGCMLDYEREAGPQSRVLGVFVRDYDTGGWVKADAATFLFGGSDAIRTPMGSGIAAFGSKDKADAAERQHGGRVMEYSKLVEARRDWTQQRLGATQAPR